MPWSCAPLRLANNHNTSTVVLDVQDGGTPVSSPAKGQPDETGVLHCRHDDSDPGSIPMSATLTGATLYLPLPTSHKLLLIGLADRASDDGLGCYPGNRLMAHYASVSDRQVRRLLHDLEVDGWIRRDRYASGGHGKAVEWELNVELIFTVARAHGWTQRTRTSVSTFGKQRGHGRQTTRTLVSGNVDVGVHPTIMNHHEPADDLISTENPRQPGEAIGEYLSRIAAAHQMSSE